MTTKKNLAERGLRAVLGYVIIIFFGLRELSNVGIGTGRSYSDRHNRCDVEEAIRRLPKALAAPKEGS